MTDKQYPLEKVLDYCDAIAELLPEIDGFDDGADFTNRAQAKLNVLHVELLSEYRKRHVRLFPKEVTT